MRRFYPLAVILAWLPLPLAAQVVQDDFADGDFTQNPPWTGDVDRFTIVETDTLNWLRSNGLPEASTIYLSTASSVVSGYWRFRFRHEFNLSTANGSRVYLVADSDDLSGHIHGYYVQLGTNNANRVELYRQDGDPGDRHRLAVSDSILVGDENTILVEITRDAHSYWTVWVDGEPVIFDTADATYLESAALGVWLRHSVNGRDRFFWTDFLADPDPGDITPPYPVAVLPTDNGAGLLVQFDQEVDPATVTTDAFVVDHDIGHPVTAHLTSDPRVVDLAFVPAIPDGDYTLTVAGVADLQGNIQYGTSINFSVTEDTEPPNLIAAAALDEWTVRVTFDEPVFGCDVELYTISPAIGQPGNIVCYDYESFDLTLDQPLTSQTVYTVTATDVSDLAGNVQPQTSATFLFGDYDIPEAMDVVINEIMYAPSDLPSNEYVEIFNRTAEGIFDLSQLRFANATSPPRVITPHATPISPGDYVVLVRNPEAFEARWPGVPYVHVTGFPALLNSGDTPQIARDDGVIIDAVPYRPNWGGAGPALERRDPDGPSFFAGNWGDSEHSTGGTPGEVNSIYEPDDLPPVPGPPTPSNDGLTLSLPFNEPLDPATVEPASFSISSGPDITSADYSEMDFRVTLSLNPALVPGDYVLHVHGVADFVGNVARDSVPFTFDPDLEPPVVIEVRPLDALTLRVRFDEPVDSLTAADPLNYSISGGIGIPAAVIWAPGQPDRVQLELAVALEGPAEYTLTVRDVEDVFGNAIDEQQVTFFFGLPEPPEAFEVVVNEIMYAPADIASNEWVELHNPTEKVFDLRDFTLGDQQSVVAITSETYLLPPGGFAVLVRNPAAFEESFPGVPFLAVGGFPVLLNGGDAVVIRYTGDSSPVTIDSVFYQPSWGGQGVSLERRNPEGPSHSPGNWASALAAGGGTPGGPNSVPPDTFPPEALFVEVAPNGRSIAVYFDEPLDTSTVAPQHFDLSEVGHPISATYDEIPEPVVDLDLPTALTGGTYTLTIDGIADLLGNATAGATISFTFEPDHTPPVIVSAIAADEETVLVRFSKAVEESSASNTDSYLISEGIGHPTKALHAFEGDASLVQLKLSSVLVEGILYEVTASGISDLAGNFQQSTAAYFILGEGAVPSPGEVAINEIMFRPAEGGSEYVELHNPTTKVFDLSGFTISNEAAPRAISPHPVLLPPGGYVAIARNRSAAVEHFGEEGAIIHMSNLPSLRNTGDAVVVRFGAATIDSVYYNPSWHRPELRDHRGMALERLDAAITAIDAGNWTSSLDPRGGTPGQPNSVSLAPGEVPGEPGIAISPSPFDANEGTVIRYRLESDAGVVRIRIFDGTGRLVRTLEHGRLAGNAREGEIIWNGRDDRNESLRVGIYVVTLEAVDLAGARTEAYRAPVVLARRWQ